MITTTEGTLQDVWSGYTEIEFRWLDVVLTKSVLSKEDMLELLAEFEIVFPEAHWQERITPSEIGNFLLASIERIDLLEKIKNENVFTNEFLEKIKKVRGISVNTCHGNEASIKKFTSRLRVETESMEGAAFLWACNQIKVKCVQLRAVSNYVEKRDKSKWEIASAVKNLNEVLIKLLS